MQYTKVLCHFDDPNNILKNEVVGGITLTGSPAYSTTNTKFGKGSVQISQYDSSHNSSSKIVSVLANSNPLFSSTDNTTIEFFVKFQGSINSNGDIKLGTAGNYSENTTFGGNGGTSDKSGASINNTNVLSTTSFSHVAFIYNNSIKKLSLYANGKRIYERSLANNPYNTRYMSFINQGQASNTYYLDELRISNCVRYTGESFTIPTQPFVLGLGVEYPDNIDGTYTTAPNKLKYYYKVTFQSSTITETSNVVNYVTEHKRRQPWAA